MADDVRRRAVEIVLGEERAKGHRVQELRDTALEKQWGCDVLSWPAGAADGDPPERIEVKGQGLPLIAPRGGLTYSHQPLQASQFQAARAGHQLRVEIVANLRAHLDAGAPYERLTARANMIRRFAEPEYQIPLAPLIDRAARGLPADEKLPLFAYGFLRPGEIAYPRIAPYVAQEKESTVTAILLERDGLRFIVAPDQVAGVQRYLHEIGDPSDVRRRPVRGALVSFNHADAIDAYEAIADLEPRNLYRWEAWDVRDGHNTVRANVLVGVTPTRGHPHLIVDDASWRSRDDPTFTDSLDVVDSIRPDGDSEAHHFFVAQMRYLLLWSSIERFVTLRWGFAQEIRPRLKQLAEEPAFQAALARHVSRTDAVVFSSVEPATKIRLDPSRPDKAVDFYYQVRSNITHRGKSAYQDVRLVEDSLRELRAIFEDVLDGTLGPRS